MSALAYIKLSELTQKINHTLENSFAQKTFWIVADITNHSFHSQKGYHYFDLAEKNPATNNITAKVQGVAWGAGSLKLTEFEQITGQKFGNDIHVLIQVGVDYHAVFGLKLILVNIDPHFSLGLIEQEKQATLRKLLANYPGFIAKSGDGYSTKNKQLKLPLVIQKIALVTSGASAGMQDFVHTLASNTFGYRFKIDNYFTQVQGEANALAFYNKLIEVHQSGVGYDVVVIIRGGGAQTDFLIFDQLILGKIVAKFPIPVITGIGHQKDETIVDLMAHTSTKTPTRAAEHIIAHNRSFEESIMNEQRTILIKTQQSLSLKNVALHHANIIILTRCRNMLTVHKDDLSYFAHITINHSKTLLYKHRSEIVLSYNHLVSRPKSRVFSLNHDLKNLQSNLWTFSRLFLSRKQAEIMHHDSIARLMSPVNILKKGFAIVYQEGKIISDADKLADYSDIIVRLADTDILSTIKSKTKIDGDLFNV
ncbi:MAG: exodeoxyribonuclease VII large subunit [Chitinophagaceae bacterium]|nr:exodeoxyribonuclease VII large subunit [Chitinophagaceae bacterium]